MYDENLSSTDDKLTFAGAVVLAFAGLITGAGLWGLYLGARALLLLCGVQFDSM